MVMDDAIFGREMTIRLSLMLFTRRVLIARRWKQFYHSVHPGRIDCRLYSRRNLPWGQPLKLPWTLHRGGVLNAGKTASSENSSVEVKSKHSVEENTCMTSFKDNQVFYTSQKV